VLRVLAGVFALLLFPLAVMSLLEKVLHIQLQTADKSLIQFMLFIFFFAYLFILGFKTPVQRIQQWHQDTEKRFLNVLGKRSDGSPKKDPPSS